MLKRFLQCIREYKMATLMSLIFISGESIIECLIPFITSDLIDAIQQGANLSLILKNGAILLGLAVLSLACGSIAGFASVKASAGFAKNLRRDLFYHVQDYSFENIDKFSTSSLVTRMTTDVTNVQMSYMMIIRIAVRAPLMLIFSVIMAFLMGGSLALSFVIVIPFLAGGLMLVARYAMPAFRRVFKKYDRLNESIEENVRAMRVVKGFSREEYEKEKFGNAAEDIRKDFTYAERLVALNSPLMQFCVYFNMIFVLTVGAYLIVKSGGSVVGVGDITAMLTYGMQILMQLMMISMIYVMLTMSGESMKRIVEVLEEKSSLTNPENPVMEVVDGSVDFNNVNFKYSEKAKRYSLFNVDIHIKSGMTVGIIGGTGAGKSSFVQLIPRLYDATDGSVLVAGVD
ncbi:MAG: ABC transporter ATP-binding protein, partial [Clostridia bacterium]|nr:ABC transporter ATP-binding protein [Clostridia bacterium]